MEIQHEEHDAIRSLLLGRTVTKVSDDTLLLDDGNRLTIRPADEGCGGCENGWYRLAELNDCPTNAIMAVEFNVGEAGYDDAFQVFVLAEDERIKLLQVEGTDNGYYGSGYWIDVSSATGA